MSLPPLHRDAVEFDAMECCALERACEQDAHMRFVEDYLTAMPEPHPLYKASLVLGIFKNTFHLAFIPHEVHRVVYSQIAAVEREVLVQYGDVQLECGHKAAEHCEVLAGIYAKMKPVQKCN